LPDGRDEAQPGVHLRGEIVAKSSEKLRLNGSVFWHADVLSARSGYSTGDRTRTYDPQIHNLVL
jgi:hypothetical protein